MAFRNLKNLVKVTVSTGYDAAATSIVLQSGDGAKCPSIPFSMVWWNSTDYPDPTDDPNVEYVLVTARTSDTLTIVRGRIEGTAASTKNTGGKTYKMAHVLTAMDARRAVGHGLFHSVPPLSSYVQSLNITNNPDWTPTGGISSATYNAKRNTILFSDQVSAAAGRLFEVNMEGRLLRTITNSNYQDTEGVCWMYDTTYAIVEEDVQTPAGTPSRITIAVIGDAATTNERTAAGNVTYELTGTGLGDLGNLGAEGVSYDPDRNLLYFCTEKSSTGVANSGIWNIWSLDPVNGNIAAVCDILQSIGIAGVATDISDMYFDRNSQCFYLLSDESNKVIKIDMAGKVIEQLSVPSWTQPEGLAFTPNMGTMIIVGEVDEFGRYEAPTSSVQDPASDEVAFTWVVVSPVTGGILGPRIPHGMKPQRIDAYVAAATSATFNIEERTTIGSAGTNLVTSDLVATTTGVSHTTAFANDNIAMGSWLYLDISATSGTPGQLVVTLVCVPE